MPLPIRPKPPGSSVPSPWIPALLACLAPSWSAQDPGASGARGAERIVVPFTFSHRPESATDSVYLLGNLEELGGDEVPRPAPDSDDPGETDELLPCYDWSLRSYRDQGSADWLYDIDDIPQITVTLPPASVDRLREYDLEVKAADSRGEELWGSPTVCGMIETPYGVIPNVGVELKGKMHNSYRSLDQLPYFKIELDS